MNTKQKIDRINKLRDDVQDMLNQQRLYQRDASYVGTMLMEIAEIQDDLDERMEAVVDSILRVHQLKKTSAMRVNTDIDDYLHETSRKVTIEVIPKASKAPKKFTDILERMSYCIPSEWMDLNDDDALDKAVRKRFGIQA